MNQKKVEKQCESEKSTDALRRVMCGDITKGELDGVAASPKVPVTTQKRNGASEVDYIVDLVIQQYKEAIEDLVNL